MALERPLGDAECSGDGASIHSYSDPCSKLDVLAIMPIFSPAPGGGAQYAEFLGKQLPRIPCVGQISILTERWPGMPNRERLSAGNGPMEAMVYRDLVRFHGLPIRLLRRYPAFVIQAAQLLSALQGRLVKPQGRLVVLVHSAFLIHPSIFPRWSQWAKTRFGDRLRVVLDCRDPSIPKKRLTQLGSFDAAISCGARLTSQLAESLPSTVPVTQIPVPMDFYDIPRHELDKTLVDLGLERGRYLFTPNGVKDSKGFPLVFDSWRKLTEQGLRLDLVVAGDTRDWNVRYQGTHEQGCRLINVGPLPNTTVRALMKGAAVVVNPSRVEALSRSCLEALSLGVPTLLPPDVPEFNTVERECVATSDHPGEIAIQLQGLIEARRVAAYNWQQHSAEAVREQYGKFLGSLFGATAI